MHAVLTHRRLAESSAAIEDAAAAAAAAAADAPSSLRLFLGRALAPACLFEGVDVTDGLVCSEGSLLSKECLRSPDTTLESGCCSMSECGA